MNRILNTMNFDGLAGSVGLIVILSGLMLSGLVCWNALVAVIRLILAAYTRESVALLVGHLSATVRERRPWPPVLRSLCLLLPWPWPWRLRNAVDQLEKGDDVATVLQTSNLLPQVLRLQASQALRGGRSSFCLWCDGLSTRSAAPHFAVRQLTFNISQAVAFLIILNFAATTIVPKIHSIFWQLDIVQNHIFTFIQWFVQWKILFTIIIFWIFVLAIGAISAWSWRRTQRLLGGRLLVIGSIAKVPEAGMGTGDQAGLSFAELSAAAGWKAQTPNELARVVAREEFRQRKIATWLPALGAAVAPLIFAIPVGALVIGIMHLLISMIYHIEALG